MTGYLATSGGARYQLPSMYEWEMSYTGGVPCDSFTLRCPYEAEMAEVLRAANRFIAQENKSVEFFGVIDEVRALCDERGLSLALSGRGMAALLLDNEAEATVYQCAATEEILRNHVQPYAISCTAKDSVRASGIYKVASGTSQWKALSDFTRCYGGFLPYFEKSGTLTLCAGRAAKAIILDGNTPVTEMIYQDKRYGVISKATVIDKSTKTRQVICNGDFQNRGGRCERIFYVPARCGAQAMRYQGAYQIEQSMENAETLRVKIAGEFAAEPGSRAEVEYSRLGIKGNFIVTEVVRSLNAQGETTTLRMQRE